MIILPSFSAGVIASSAIQGSVSGLDPDSIAYISAVETADGQLLEYKIKKAIDNFIVGCKADGIWNAIKASCLLAGPRTLSGALIPLKGTAPTNFNFTSSDYIRTIGLQGDGNSKYLNTNRADNADARIDHHLAVYATSDANYGAGTPQSLIGSIDSCNSAATWIETTQGGVALSSRTSGPSLWAMPNPLGFFGATRNSLSFYQHLSSAGYFNDFLGANLTSPNKIFVFCRNNGCNGAGSGTPISFTNRRLSFYSIGSFLDLVKLKTRVELYMNEII